MIHLKLRTEYSFRRAYGKLPAVLDAAGGTAAAMTDNGTWGFVQFSKECKRRGVAPIYGWEVVVVDNPTDKARQPQGTVVLLAKNEVGLEALYNLSTWAGKHGFYYYPRIGYQQLATLDPNVILLVGPGCFIPKIHPGPNRYLQLSPESPMWNHAALGSGWPCVPVADNYFPTPPDRVAYEVLAADNKNDRSSPMHILGEWELRAVIPGLTEEHFANTHMIAAQCKAVLPHAEIVKPYRPDTLHGMCMEGAVKRGIAFRSAEGIEWMQVDGAVYTARLKRELDLIHEKQFEDYFYLIADVVQYAKEHMLVGPARGSSAGSLACYLLAITDVDPIVHDLMFERFIDVTRADLPDIDIDFQDTKRELVIAYLQRTYGEARVGRIGTVMRYKAKSTLTDVAKQLNIPDYEIKDVKDAVIERSTGDARAQFCILDALDSLEVGKALVAKYPAIRVSSELEGHARQSGMHAAGIIVCEEPITRYATIDRSGAAQIDKKDAEVLNLLKIDALGLRTLSVLQDALDQIGKTRDWLVTYPLTDEDAFDIFNQDRYSGIFQYEGYALQSLTRQMKIRNFDDIVIITALARPGPLHCGAATEFIARRIGRDPVTHLHPLVADITAPTYGTVIYQEQVMAIGRKMGNLSWEDVSELRKAMSKSLGEEFFNTYWEKFKVGAMAQGIDEYTARSVWDRMCTFGSWAFNKSHAVSYGMISYWCAVFKAHYPLEYAAACLRNVKDQDQGIQLLRELVMEGFTYKPVDPQKSGLTWAVVEGELVGGLTNVKGIGQKTALDILERRMVGKPLTPSMAKKLIAPTTPYDDIFEGTRRFADVYLNPPAHKVTSGPVAYIKEVQDAGDYVVLAKLKEKNLRDLNEYGNVVKRGGRLVAQHNLFLNMVIEDDTGSIIVRVGRYQYAQWGKPLVESAKIGDWFLWRGRINGDGWRLLYIEKWRKMETFALADRHMAVNADLLKRIAGTTLTLAEVTTDEVD